MLHRALTEEEPEGEDTEESYQRLFPKIGRDFVAKEDLEQYMRQILSAIDPSLVHLASTLSDTSARRKALEYRNAAEFGGMPPEKDLLDDT